MDIKAAASVHHKPVRMFGILDRYVGKNVLLTVLFIALCLAMFTGLITFIDKTRYIGRGNVDFYFVCWYLLMHLPGFFVAFFPVAVLLGGVIGLGILARNSEIIVMQTSGLSRMNIALSSLKSLVPLILAVMWINEYVVPPMEQYAESRLTEVSSKGSITVNKTGIWLKEQDAFIGIRMAMTDGTLRGIVRYDVDKNVLVSVRRAAHARYEHGMWRVEDVSTTRFTPHGVVQGRDKFQLWKLNITPERVNVIGNTGNFLTIKGLGDYIGYLEENRQDSRAYRLELYNKLLLPVVTVLMFMLALSTVFGPLRTMNMGTRILCGAALGFAYYVLNQILAPLSLVYGIPPLLGASMASWVFGALAVTLLCRRA